MPRGGLSRSLCVPSTFGVEFQLRRCVGIGICKVRQYGPSERIILGATVGLLGGLLGGLVVGAFLDRFDHPAFIPDKLALSIVWAIVGIFAGVACYTRRTS